MPHITELYRLEQEQIEEEATMGVSTHSQPKTLAIISAPTERLAELQRSIKTFTGNTPVTVTGTFKGEKEVSFLVGGLTDEQATDLAHRYNQTCWLKLENHKHGTYRAYFVTNGQAVGAGYLRSVSYDLIEKLGLDYTFRPDTGEFFTIWPTDTTIMKDFNDEVVAALAGKMGRVV